MRSPITPAPNSYCNYCKNFTALEDWQQAFSSRLSRHNSLPHHTSDWYGVGYCNYLNRNCQLGMSCASFERAPLKNMYNIDDINYIDDWATCRKIVSYLWADIIEYKIEHKRETNK